MNDEKQAEKVKIFRAMALGLGLGFLIAGPLAMFLLAGLFLDKKFHTLPIFLISFLIISLVATFLEVRFLILPFLEKGRKK